MKRKGQGEIIFVIFIFIAIVWTSYLIKTEEKLQKTEEKLQISPEGLAFKEKCTSFCESRNGTYYISTYHDANWQYSYCTCVINDEEKQYTYSPNSGIFLKR